MTFLSPTWLALVAPFAALIWWTLRAAPKTRWTTSAFLWTSTPIASSSRARRLPPAWTIAALAAIGMTIVALAAPARRDRPRVFVVDDPSYRTTSAASVLATLTSDDVDATLVVPGQPDAMTLADVRSTAQSTGDDVLAAVARLRREARDVIVLSDAAIEPGEHVRMIGPPPRTNASIERIGARSNGAGVDVFVRVARTVGSPDNATLTVRSGDAVVKKAIELTGDATSADAFVRLARAGDAIEARVTMSGDAVALDDVARLSRDAASDVRVVIDGPVSSSIDRFAAAYARVHPGDGGTAEVALTRDARAGGRTIVVGDGAPIAAGPTRRVEHPITADVDLDALPATEAAMPTGFTAIACRGDRAIIATRDVAGRRAAWLAIDADAAARDAAFVVLLDQAIAWTAGGEGAGWSAVSSDLVPRVGWRAKAVDDARVEASPGVYVDADGRSRAVNLPSATTHSSVVDPVDLSAWLASRGDRAAWPMTAWPASIAAIFAGVAAVLSVVSPRRPANLDVRALAT